MDPTLARKVIMPLLLVIYLAFIGLGLPDSLLGSAWPAMYGDLGASISLGGVVSMTSCLCTITSSLLCGRLVRRLGTGRLVLASVALTAVALFGYASCTSLWQLVVWAVPYGLGAGAVDAALNAYVATHYEARHMNWLHCMWGIGCSVGPAIMAAMVASAPGWRGGYRVIGVAQVGIVIALVASLRLWGSEGTRIDTSHATARHRGLRPLALPGVWQALVGFFCYCAIESTTGLWVASHLVLSHGTSEGRAALFAGLFFAGITLGRLASGFLTLRLDGRQLQRLGEVGIACGALLLLGGLGELAVACGIVLVGLGCAPIYPQMIHLTPERFGEENAATLMGVQMACAYMGSLAVPPLVGLLIERVSPMSLPVVVLVLVGAMTACLESCDRVAMRGRL